jgi:hypothetical protein
MAINKALLKEDLAKHQATQKRNSTPNRTRRGGPYAKSG